MEEQVARTLRIVVAAFKQMDGEEGRAFIETLAFPFHSPKEEGWRVPWISAARRSGFRKKVAGEV